MSLRKFYHEFTKGILRENALLVSMIGLCSALAVSTKMENGIYMGFAATFVTVASEVLVSLFRRFIPEEIRIPIFIVVIATFVTIVDLTLQAFNPAMYKVLGIWIPLIVVNCMILGRVEIFASRKNVFYSIADALGIGLGFTLVLVVMGFIRETLGSGKLVAFGKTLIMLPAGFEPIRILIMFPGAFLTFAFLIVLTNLFLKKGSR